MYPGRMHFRIIGNQRFDKVLIPVESSQQGYHPLRHIGEGVVLGRFDIGIFFLNIIYAVMVSRNNKQILLNIKPYSNHQKN